MLHAMTTIPEELCHAFDHYLSLELARRSNPEGLHRQPAMLPAHVLRRHGMTMEDFCDRVRLHADDLQKHLKDCT